MATNNHNHLQLPELDHFEPRNGQHDEAMHLGQKLLLHHGRDVTLRIGQSNYEGMAARLNDAPSSSRAVQCPTYRNTVASHASYVHCPGSSSNHLAESAVSYPHRSEEGMSSCLENRRAAVKRKNTIVHAVDGISLDGYYVGSSSNTQASNYPQPNPESVTQMQLSIGQSGLVGQQLFQQEGFQRNVRARHNNNISLEPRPATTHTASNIFLSPLQSFATASPSPIVARNQTVSLSARTAPSGVPGINNSAWAGPYYTAMGSSNLSVPVVPTAHGSSRNASFDNGSYAPRTVNSIHSNPASAVASSSRVGSRAVRHETVLPSCPPGFSAASSTSLQIGQSYPPDLSAPSSTTLRMVPTRSAAATRHARHVVVGHANNGRHRRARSSYYAFHPSMMEAERLMLAQLGFVGPREAADPHRDLRLDVDNMSYEDLLALGEFIGNVNTGLAEDKISGCVREVVCCSSDPSQNDEDDGTCAVCLEDYKDKDLLGTLKCNHDFHAECIKKWLQVKNSCPRQITMDGGVAIVCEVFLQLCCQCHSSKNRSNCYRTRCVVMRMYMDVPPV